MATVVSSTVLPFDAETVLGPGVEYIAPDSGSWSREHLLATLSELQPEGLIVPLTERVDRELLEASEKLRVVGNFAVGYDNVDLATATSRQVVVANTPGVLTDATADFAFALLLGIARRLVEGHGMVASGNWTGFAPNQLLGAAVSGATLGIVGLGRIGKAVARRARGFGMEVIYSGNPKVEASLLGARHVDSDTLFKESDFVSLHCPLTKETENLVNQNTLSLMKTSAFLVNTARGRCVDEVALFDALKNRRIAGAALDVFAREPLIEEGLSELPNVLLAPHAGSATRTARARMGELCARAVAAVFRGVAPSNALNPEAMV